MPRDAFSNYALPAGNPVVTGTTIASSWANTTLNDIATALTQSLSTDGSTVSVNLSGKTMTGGTHNNTAVTGSSTWNGTGSIATTSSVAAGTLSVTGAATIGAGATITGATSVTGTIAATGSVTGGSLVTGGVLSVTGAATIGAGATITGATAVTGTIAATGSVTGGSLVTGGALSVTGAATIGAGATITGATAVTGTITATGNVTGGNLITGGTLNVTGGATIGGGINLSVTGQIAFPATQVASSGANILDDYEEGTWTPAITIAVVGNANIVYAVVVGYYTKVGDLVAIGASIVTSTFTWSTSSGDVSITGLPFASRSGYTGSCALGLISNFAASASDQFGAVFNSSSATISLYRFNTQTGSAQTISIGILPTGTQKNINLGGTYKTST